MKWLSFLLKRQLIVGLAVVFILILGLFSLNKLDIEMMPTVNFDGANVLVMAGDISSIDLEDKVTNVLEQRISAIDGVESFTSNTSIGHVSINVVFERGRGDEVFTELENSMNSVKHELSQVDVLETMRYSTNFGFEMFMDLYDGDPQEMSAFATEILKPRLESLPEVREVKLEGVKEKEIILTFKKERLEEYGLDIQQIMHFLQQENQTIAVGQLRDQADQPTLRWDTRFRDLHDLKNLSLPTPLGFKKLHEVATISYEPKESSSIAWKNGIKNYVLVQIGRSTKSTEVAMTEAVRQEVDKIKEEGLVEDFKLEEMVSRGDFVSSSINNVTTNVLYGAILAFITVFLFLRAFRATLIVGISIPLSILLTFSMMWILGYSFNMISLIALGLGIGMMVDASIVILESIYAKRQLGLSKYDSVIEGTRDVAGAVIASMLTTIVVFLPIGLLGDSVGELMRNLSVVIVITLVSSVLVSFTLIPVLSNRFLKVKEKKEAKEKGVLHSYGKIISWMAARKRRRWLVLFTFFIIFVGSIPLLIFKVPMSVMPDMFDRQAELVVVMEQGTTPAEREEIAEEVNRKLSLIEDIKNYTVIIFDNTFMYSFINMTSVDEATLSQDEVNSQIYESLREMIGTYPIEAVQATTSAPSGGMPIQVKIKGDSLEKLKQQAELLSTRILEIEGITDVTHSMKKTMIEQHFVLNLSEVEKAGLLPSQIKDQLQAAFLDQQVGFLDIEGITVPLRIRMDQLIRTQADVSKYKIRTTAGEKEASNFIQLEEIETPIEIRHDNGERAITISADFDKALKDLGTINREVQQIVDVHKLPSGYAFTLGGELKQQQELMEDMLLVLVISIFLVYVVMAIQFNHLLHPVIVMSILPMTIVGVSIGLFITQKELNAMSGMGILMLMGIVVNNAILLIDRTRQLREERLEPNLALIEAGKSRMRPIFMTTLSTAFGMLPLALATGNASNYQGPMATVVISGLLFATFITLLLIPAVYMIFEDISSLPKLIRSKFNRKSKQKRNQQMVEELK